MKQAVAGEQSGGTLVSDRSRVGLGSGEIYMFICHGATTSSR